MTDVAAITLGPEGPIFAAVCVCFPASKAMAESLPGEETYDPAKPALSCFYARYANLHACFKIMHDEEKACLSSLKQFR